MRALIQRVSFAEVKIGQELCAQIGQGLLVFIGVTHSDTRADAEWLSGKISRLRIFEDEAGKMNLSVKAVNGSILIVSQFTLYGDCRRGNRPGFDQAALPSAAEPLYELFCDLTAAEGIPVQTGRFAADMDVALVNDGPVTIWLESPASQ